MKHHAAWMELDADLAAAPGTVSVYCGALGATAAYTRAVRTRHYAASTMKVAVLAAMYRAGLDLDVEVPVHNEFQSAAPGAPAYACHRRYDNDDAVWDRVGGVAPLGWLAHRMIVRSSNLATNLVLAQVGLPAVAAVWDVVGAGDSVVGRGIEDTVAADAGISNLVTAADLGAVFTAIAVGVDRPGPLAPPAACRAMMGSLCAQEGVEDLAAGLPTGTRVAHKNGWIRGVRHGAGVVFPDDAPPFVLAVCTTTPWAINQHNDAACQLVSRVARAAWTARHTLAPAAST
jgi:beta-lactamase class A